MGKDNDAVSKGLRIFTEETRELLETAESTLLSLEEDPNNTDLIAELFRNFHTIKGASASFSFDEVVDFTHVVENVIGKVREEVLGLDETLISLLLDCRDHIKELIGIALGSSDQRAQDHLIERALREKLSRYTDAADIPQHKVTTDAENTSEEDICSPTLAKAPDQVSNKCWHLSIRFSEAVGHQGFDPIDFIRPLNELGEIVHLTLVDDTLPFLDGMDSKVCYLGIEIDLFASVSKHEIEEKFDLILSEVDVHILPPHDKISEYQSLIDALPEENVEIGVLLVRSGALTGQELSRILKMQERLRSELKNSVIEPTLKHSSKDRDVGEIECSSTGTGNYPSKVPKVGEIAVSKGLISEPVVDAALDKQSRIRDQKKKQQQSIRISSDKLGSLIDLVGELVISSAHLGVQAKDNQTNDGAERLIETSENMARLIDDLRDVSLSLRMVEIGETFTRYKRIVRDLGREFDKKISFQIEGGDTELDKTVIEKISDPLMHMVRNAIDHGIETAEERKRCGKPEHAQLCLSAYHESGNISIQVKDDGRGLDRDKILEKALSKGMVKSEQILSDSEVYRLIFEPGFSTAEQVSNISGRGVGMDVVRRNIEELRGQIEIESTLGKGSTFTIQLPLTLAIIDGFHVDVAGVSYIIPLTMVEECIELSSRLNQSESGGDYLSLRGEVLPFMRLKDLFSASASTIDTVQSAANCAISDEDQQGEEDTVQARENIVVVHCAGQKAGLVVDQLLGEQQTVIKPLGKIFQQLDGISGATILGGGDVAMIIDVPKLISLAN